MIDWSSIKTVLLDMDGTLLDLHYDNHFWLEYVPRRYGEKHGLSATAAKEELLGRYRKAEGTLEWYCIDYWSRQLGLDIAMRVGVTLIARAKGTHFLVYNGADNIIFDAVPHESAQTRHPHRFGRP